MMLVALGVVLALMITAALLIILRGGI